jgi:hypothetical protein
VRFVSPQEGMADPVHQDDHGHRRAEGWNVLGIDDAKKKIAFLAKFWLYKELEAMCR